MIAITVILSAVIATFVLDITDNEESAPQVSFDIGYQNATSDNLTVVINGATGQQITASEIGFKGSSLGTNVDSRDTMADISGAGYTAGTVVRAGDGVVLENAGGDVDLEVVWIDESGKASARLAEFTGPNA